ncbi:MAG TPA: SRPBCC domain-containing protein [Phycisphaerales bacterium]|nr:SRPBCC domain-containing protein [Phycisphaerales bacterium]
MIRREDDGYWIEHEQRIAVHHELTFACLTTGAGLSMWFPVSAEVDLRPGGLITLGWDEKARRRTTIAILDYDAGGRITWDWYAAHRDQHAPIYWRVEPDVERGSILKFRQGPFAADEDSLVGMALEAQFWAWHVCNLRAVLEAKHDMRTVRPL